MEEALENKNSLFYTYQRLIALRKLYPCMAEGNYETLDTGNPLVLAYRKFDDVDEFVVLVNFSNQAQEYRLEEQLGETILIHNYSTESEDTSQLRPFEALVYKK